MDTLFALFAAIAMFTIILSVPEMQDRMSGSTMGMLFITLPDLFYTNMPGGIILAPAFFILVGFAALSSTISLGEVVTSLMIDKKGWSRPKATVICAGGVFVGSILAALSLGAVEPLSSFELIEGKPGVLATLDKGAPITGFSTKGSWLRVTSDDGKSGWIHLSLVTTG